MRMFWKRKPSSAYSSVGVISVSNGQIVNVDFGSGRSGVFGMPASSGNPFFLNNVVHAIKTVPAITRAVGIISGTIGNFPWQFRDSIDQGSVIDEPELNYLLNVDPAPGFTGSSFRKYLVRQLIVYGGVYVIPQYGPRSNQFPVALNPVACTYVDEEIKNGERLYVVKAPNRPPVTLESNEIIPMYGDDWDGSSFSSPLASALESARNSVMMRDHLRDTISVGSMQNFAITVKDPESFDKDAAKDFLDSFQKRLESGGVDARAPLVLTGDVVITPLSITPQGIELIAQRQFETVETIRALGVPLSLVGIEEGNVVAATTIAEQSQQTLRFTLNSYIDSLTGAFTKFFGERGKRWLSLYTDGFVRSTPKERDDLKSKLYMRGVLTANEARASLGYNPIDYNSIDPGDRVVEIPREAKDEDA